MPTSSGRPLLVAHRGGNTPESLRRAEAFGADVVEADVHLHSASRVDVRHARRFGWLPVLCDDGRLSLAGRRPLTLDDLLAAARPTTPLLIDLKGRDPRLGDRVAQLVAPELGRREVWVCSRHWELLEPFAGEARVRIVPSVGTRGELWSFLRRGGDAAGVSIRESLLTASLVARLGALAELVVAWTVNRPERAAELAAWGVDALTSDDLPALAAALPSTPLAAAA